MKAQVRNYQKATKIWWALIIWLVACFIAGILVGHFWIKPAHALGFNRADCIFPARASATACEDTPCDIANAIQGGSGNCPAYVWPADGQFQSAAPAQDAGGQAVSKYQLQGK